MMGELQHIQTDDPDVVSLTAAGRVSAQQVIGNALTGMAALLMVFMAANLISVMIRDAREAPLDMLPHAMGRGGLRRHRLTAAEAEYLDNLGGRKRDLFRPGATIEEALSAKGYMPGDILDEGTFKGWERALERMPGRPRSLQSRLDALEDRIADLDEAIDRAEDEERDTSSLEARRRALEGQLAELECRLAEQEDGEA